MTDIKDFKEVIQVVPLKVVRQPNTIIVEDFIGRKGENIPEITDFLGTLQGGLTQFTSPGWVGGNHVHQTKREVTLVYNPLTFYVQNPVNQDIIALIVPAYHKVYLSEGFPHAVENHTQEIAQLQEFHNYGFIEGDENDIKRLPDNKKLDFLFKKSGQKPLTLEEFWKM